MIAFAPLAPDDLPLLHRWLNLPHVKQWWGDADAGYAEVVAHYTPRLEGDEPVHSFLIHCDGVPVGFIQTYLIRDFSEYGLDLPPEEHIAGVDLFIGEPAYLNRGIGSRALRQFLDEIVFGELQSQKCMIDPEPANVRAIRAYERAGFRYVRTIQRPHEAKPSYIMRVDRHAITS